MEELTIPNYSQILKQNFKESSEGVECYCYLLVNSDLFGVLLPFEFKPLPKELLFPLGTKILSKSDLDLLKDFQNTFWKDLLRNPKEGGTSSQANYLTVPLKNQEVDWEVVKKSQRLLERTKLSQIPTSERKDLIIQSTKRNKAVFEYVGEVSNTSSCEEFFRKLLGEHNPYLETYIQKYSGFDIWDAVFDEQTDIVAISEFQNIVLNGELSYIDESEPLIFASCIKSAKSKNIDQEVSTSHQKHGNPIVNQTSMEEFYLSKTHLKQSYQLLQSLVTLESYSYVVELSRYLNYQGPFFYINQACTAPIINSLHNYDDLETLGDTILKYSVALYAFADSPNSAEKSLSQFKGRVVSNENLADAMRNQNLITYLRTRTLPVGKFRPPYYLSKWCPGETQEITMSYSEGMYADFFEALVGACYAGENLKSAAERIFELLCLPNFERLEHLFPKQKIEILSKFAASHYQYHRNTKIRNLVKFFSPKNTAELQKALKYEFTNPKLLERALNHKSVSAEHYESLEFLGDAVLDLVVLCNIYPLSSYTADELHLLKQILVNNHFLAKVSVGLGLHKLVSACPEILRDIQNFEKNVNWEEELTNFGVFGEGNKVLADVFEALIGAVLVDSKDIALTARIFGEMLSKSMLHLVFYKENCKTHISERLHVHAQKTHKKLKVDVQACEGAYIGKVVFGEKEFSVSSHSKESARSSAIILAYQKLNL